ncbi:Uncharacterised protein [Escherichia coli]|nr:Uncharacterised protein [Escherichia coli]
MNAFIMQKMIMKLSLLDFQENTYLSFHQMETTIRFLMMKKNSPRCGLTKTCTSGIYPSMDNPSIVWPTIHIL